MSRTSERNSHPVDVRVVFLENDADEQERAVEAMEGKLGRMLGILVGILVSTTTAAILLAFNLAVAST